MTPWDILIAALATFLVLSLFFSSIAFFIIMVKLWQEWKIEKMERILEMEHRESES